MNTSTNTGTAASAVLPQRKAPVLPVTPRPPFQILQTSRAPAQLSLFLRAGLGSR